MKARNKRLMFIIVGVTGLAVAAGLVLNALNSNIAFFYSPSEVKANKAPINPHAPPKCSALPPSAPPANTPKNCALEKMPIAVPRSDLPAAAVQRGFRVRWSLAEND